MILGIPILESLDTEISAEKEIWNRINMAEIEIRTEGRAEAEEGFAEEIRSGEDPWS